MVLMGLVGDPQCYVSVLRNDNMAWLFSPIFRCGIKGQAISCRTPYYFHSPCRMSLSRMLNLRKAHVLGVKRHVNDIILGIFVSLVIYHMCDRFNKNSHV